MNDSQKEALYGKPSPFSEHKAGEIIQFYLGAEIKSGTILHVRAPAPSPMSGVDLPLLYLVDIGEGFPAPITSSQIVEGSFTACLGTYGYPDSALRSREEAENLAWNVEGQVITQQDGNRLHVNFAHLEGDEKQGKVLAECEAAEESS